MAATDLIFRFVGVDAGAGREFDRMAGKASATSNSLKAFGALGLVALGTVAVASIKAAGQFQSSMELIHTQAGASQAEVDKMSQAVLGLAGPTATAPMELAKGLYHIESTGVRGAKALDELRTAAEGAQIGQANLEDVTNALNATVVSGIPGAQNMTAAMGALNATVGAGDMHMQDLADALGTGVLGIVKGFGVTLNDASAALALFGDNNLRGAAAGTALRMTVMALAKPATTGADALKALGLTSTTLRKDMESGGLIKALTDLHDRLVATGNTGSKMSGVLTDAFGRKTAGPLIELVGQFTRFQQKTKAVADGAKNFGADWQATTKTLAFQWKSLTAGASALGIQIGDALIPAASALLGVFGHVAVAGADLVSFFLHNKIAAAALAAVLAARLLPAVLASAKAMASSVYEDVGIRFLLLADRVKAAGAAFSAAEGMSGKMGAALGALNLNPVSVGFLAIGAAAVVGMSRAAAAAAKGKQTADDFAHAIQTDTASLASLGMAATSTGKFLGDTFNAGPKAAGGFDAFSAQMAEAIKNNDAAERSFQTAKTNVAAMGRTFGLSAADVQKLAAANGIDLSGPLDSTTSKIGAAALAVRMSHHPLQAAANDFSQLGSKALSASDDITILDTNWDRLVGNFIGAKQATLDAKNSLVALDQALHKSHNSLNLHSQASRDARAALLAMGPAIHTVIDSTFKSSGSYDKAAAAAHHWLNGIKASGAAGPLVQSLTDRIDKYLANLANRAPVYGHTTGSGFADGIQRGTGAAAGAAKSLVSAAAHNLAGAAQSRQLGAEFSAGYAIGIRGGINAIVNAAADAGAAAVAAAKSVRGHNGKSPSRKMIAAGHDFGAGYVIGINDSTGKVQAAAAMLADTATVTAKAKTHKLSNVARLVTEGLLQGFRGLAGSLRSALSTPLQNALAALDTALQNALSKQEQRLKAARSRLDSVRQSRRGDIRSLAGTISGGADISGIFSTDSNGNEVMGNAAQFLSSQVGPLRQEAGILRKLAAHHMKAGLLSQIANLPVSEAIQVGQQFLSGGSSVHDANQAYAAIQKYSTQAASTVEDKMYARRIAHAEHHEKVVQRELVHLRHEVHRIAEHAGSAVAGGVTIQMTNGRIEHVSEAEARLIEQALKRYRRRVGQKT